jgi:hypothetical protein
MVDFTILGVAAGWRGGWLAWRLAGVAAGWRGGWVAWRLAGVAAGWRGRWCWLVCPLAVIALA